MFNTINLQAFVHFFHAYPHSASVIAFCIVFAESLAIIGAIVPGAILMPALGFLVGSETIPLGSTFFSAFCGAFIADYLSYLLGVYYQSKIHKLWPFRKYPKLLERSEDYFRHHGGKSIFFGRFIGPIRAMIPMVAGMMRLSQIRFILADIPTAFIWVIAYSFPGVLLGALSLELPPKVATQFTLCVLLGVIIIWACVWLIQMFFKRVWYLIDAIIKKAWYFLQTKKATHWFTMLLTDPRAPDNHSQLTLLILAFLSAVTFIFISIHLLTQGILTSLNEPIYYFLTSLRIPTLDRIVVLITLFGDEKTMLLSAAIILMWLLIKRYWYIAVHWFALMSLCAASIIEVKELIFSPRPHEIASAVMSSSFPSGHTALTVTLFGFLAVIIARELPPEKRRIPYTFAAILTLLIGFSRIYLGAHWLSDVIGSIFLGLTIVLLVTIAYRRRHTVTFDPRKFSLVIGSIFMVVWIAHSFFAFHKQYQDYIVKVPTPAISWNSINNNTAIFPLYRVNRLGEPIQVFNVRLIGDLNSFKHSLIKQGWLEQPVQLNFQRIIRSFSITSINHHFPLLPQLYAYQPPALLLVKPTDHDDALLILTLWNLHAHLSEMQKAGDQARSLVNQNASESLWIGSIEYHHASPKVFSLHQLKNHAPFIGATEQLEKYLRRYAWHRTIYTTAQQPKEMWDLRWDGKVLLILN
jgi:membrane protein DedA with SNARE-associated domain/membrane-associated phospholipid phosphatase